MATVTKKEAYPWKAGASSGHTTNLKQSILRLSISMIMRRSNVLSLPLQFVFLANDQGIFSYKVNQRRKC